MTRPAVPCLVAALGVASGSKLIGVLVNVCSDHGGALGPYDFGITFGFTDSGQAGPRGAGDEVDARFSWATGS